MDTDDFEDIDDPSMVVQSSFGEDSSMNVTNDSFFAGSSVQLPTSTPEKARLKKAAKPRFKTPKLWECQRCNSTYTTECAFQKHVRWHTFKGLAEKTVTQEQIESAFVSSIPVVLSEMGDSPSAGKWEAEYVDFLNSIKEDKSSTPWLKFCERLCSEMKLSLQRKVVVMPSAIWGCLVQSMNVYLNDKVNRQNLTDLLSAVKTVSKDVFFSFIVEFANKMAVKVVASLGQQMKAAAGMPDRVICASRSKDDFSEERDRSTAHYIEGAIIKAFLKKSLRFRKSVLWQKILDVIATIFVRGGFVPACPSNIEAWTAAISRGKLTFLGQEGFEFFRELASLVQSMEHVDGSLGHNAVLSAVFKSDSVIFLWDNIIETSLNEQESMSFLTAVVKSVTNVMGRGIVNRRLNLALEKGSVCVGLRGQLGAFRERKK